MSHHIVERAESHVNHTRAVSARTTEWRYVPHSVLIALIVALFLVTNYLLGSIKLVLEDTSRYRGSGLAMRRLYRVGTANHTAGARHLRVFQLRVQMAVSASCGVATCTLSVIHFNWWLLTTGLASTGALIATLLVEHRTRRQLESDKK